jgi:hypothetical protein
MINDFYLVLIKNDGSIVHNIFATSHKDLVSKYITPEDEKNKTYFRAAYMPKNGCKLDDIDNYELKIAEVYIPGWFEGIVKEKAMALLHDIIESMIIKGRKQLLLHEGAILTGNAVVDEVKHSVVFAMYDNAHIKVVDNGSEIHRMTDDTFIDELCDNVKIEEVWGFAKIKEMHDYSKIMKIYGQGKVGKMFDHSRIAMLKGDANIMSMEDQSQADRLKHMSKVDEMHNHSVIEEMWDWTVVEKMFDQSRINYMDEDSRVLEMFGDSTIEVMYGNAIVEKLYENSLVRKLQDAAQILEKKLKE